MKKKIVFVALFLALMVGGVYVYGQTVTRKCTTCNGTGRAVRCTYCGATGVYSVYTGFGQPVKMKCPACNGTGKITCFSCEGTGVEVVNQAPPSDQPFTDSRDGKKYKTVVIGGKRWFAENLNYQTPGGSWCYDNNSSNCNKYGRLYDWNTARSACPAGFHLPKNGEWKDLIATAGDGTSESARVAAKKLRSKIGWDSHKGIVNEDTYGFSALPGGARDDEGDFDNIGGYGLWWTATEEGSGNAITRDMNYDSYFVYNSIYDKSFGFSVRCVTEVSSGSSNSGSNNFGISGGGINYGGGSSYGSGGGSSRTQCRSCGGTGRCTSCGGNYSSSCSYCNGNGKTTYGYGSNAKYETCAVCRGSGRSYCAVCYDACHVPGKCCVCKGSGYID